MSGLGHFLSGAYHNVLQPLTPILNAGKGFNAVRDSAESVAALVGNYYLPGSSLLTSHLVSKGAQNELNSPLGQLGQAGTGLAGAGVGSATTGIPSASSVGGGWTNTLNGLGSALSSTTGLTSLDGVGTNLSALAGTGALQGPTSGGSPLSGSSAGIGGNGGSSTFGLGASLAHAIGGFADNAALKKAKQQLLEGNNAQMANLDSFDPSGITSDPGYIFNRDQGELGLNRMLSAQGNLQSGAADKEAIQYNQNYANNGFKDYYSRWADKTGAKNNLIGSNATNQAGLGIAQANNLGSSLLGTLAPSPALSAADLLKLMGRSTTGVTPWA